MSISHMKSIFAALVVVAVVGAVPKAHAVPTVNPLVLIEGSSAMWTATGLGAWNNGSSYITGGGITCHWTSGSNKVNLVDTRSSVPNVDPGTLWVVWDNNASAATCAGDGTNANTNVWAYLKVDSVVGVRCWFANPKCELTATSANINVAGGGKISSTLWGSDANIPSYIQPLFTGTTLITVGATDIRPEDAAFAMCRVNSTLGASAVSVGSDGLDGLGYNSNNAAGVCPVYNISTAQSKGVGNPILSAVSILEGGTTVSQANVLAFNITGHDPITNGTVSAYTVTAVGAAPIVFVVSRSGALANLTNATENQLQQVFSGATCDASAFGLPAGPINVFLREPLSGTMNTTEASVFRRPTVYPNPILGVSQETGVNPSSGTGNPLNQNCVSSGKRWRAIGTGEAVAGVQKSQASFGGLDGIAYTFMSYGNVAPIIGNSYGYLQLNGVDPVWASYSAKIDPAQSTNPGNLPNQADLPATCAGGLANFPCNEAKMWANGFSYPNLRNGTYRAWSLLRLIATGTANTNVLALVKATQVGVVNIIPDYVPAVAVTGTTDLGIKLLRSHYAQKDGAGVQLGAAGVATDVPEKGGDMGGMIIPTAIGITTEHQVQIVQSGDANGGLGPAVRQ